MKQSPALSFAKPDRQACSVALAWPLALLAVMPVLAWSAPDAGSVLRQIEPQAASVLPKPSPRNSAWAEPADALPGEPTTLVQSFRIVGNQQLTDRQLQRALRGFVDRPLSLSQMKQAAQVVMNRYRKAGWMARAYLPRQEIDQGVVTIRVVEVAFGGAKLPLQTTQRVKAQQLLSMVEAAQPKGAALNVAQIDRALLLMDDLPGVSVGGNYVPGDLIDQTALQLKATDEAVVTGSVGLDNHGARSTGAERLLLNISVNSPAGLGDQLSATVLKSQNGHSRNSQYVRLAYSFPVGSHGWRLGAHASDMAYRAQTDQTGQGDSQTWGIDASYPLLRSMDQNIYATLAVDRKRFASQSGTVADANRHRMAVVNFGLSGNQLDDWGRGGVTSASLSWVFGQVSDVTDATQGAFQKWSATLSRQQNLGTGLTLLASANLQRTPDSLDSSEKMYLGGASSVRAYPGSEAAGDEGQSFSLELRQKLDAAWTVFGFVDQARVKPKGGSTSEPVKLAGHGLGLMWQSPHGTELRATVSRRDGRNPDPMADGHDHDGTLKLNRVWLSLSTPF